MNTAEYIKRIRNKGKRAYAEAYLTWIKTDGVNADREPHSPDFGISFMAGQAVRMNIADLVKCVG